MSDDYLPFGLYIYINHISVCVARSNSTRNILHLQKRGSLATVAGSCPSWTLNPSDMSDFAPKGLRDFRSFLRIFPKESRYTKAGHGEDGNMDVKHAS